VTREPQIVGGRELPSHTVRWWTVTDPATGAAVCEVPWGDGDDAAAAIDAAAAAWPAWAGRTAYERGAALERAAALIAERAEVYARRTTEESGKPLAQSRAEWAGAPNYLRVAAEEARRLGGRWVPARLPGRRIDVTYQPLGVVGVVTAWNFPVYNLNRAASSALAAGCCVVLRPSELTPRSAIDYVRALTDAGVPPGVINVVTGEAHPIGQRMLDDPRCRKLAFTGSTRVGRILMEGAARTVTRLALELGGNAPVLVFPDVQDLPGLARAAVAARHRNCGQVCIAPQRFYVHAEIFEAFVAGMAAAIRDEVVGPGLDPRTTVGPLINARQRERVHDLVQRSVAAGAAPVVGGGPVDGPGWFSAPTFLRDVPPDAPVLTEEIFGPVTPVVRFERAEEALALANATEYGLAAFLWTRDLKTAVRVSEQLEFGLVGVNDWYPVTAEAPFGGFKQSGLGRESGLEGVHEYVEAKTRYFGGLG
jgi:acyl-CoA reductase-like NAD-dependent aldehyde dehydrogenase